MYTENTVASITLKFKERNIVTVHPNNVHSYDSLPLPTPLGDIQFPFLSFCGLGRNMCHNLLKGCRQGFPLERGWGINGDGEEGKGLTEEIKKKWFSFFSQDMIISEGHALGYSDHLLIWDIYLIWSSRSSHRLILRYLSQNAEGNREKEWTCPINHL